MYNNLYLTKIRNTPISSEPYVDVEEDFDVMMARIIKRTGKWVEWKAKRRALGFTSSPSLGFATLFPRSRTPRMLFWTQEYTRLHALVV